MELELEREQPEEERMFGTLWIDGAYFCETLEDPARDTKIPGKTAIPKGRYRISMENSPRFGKNTITLNDVPDFTHIRIHAGNTESDTEGCILVGQERTEASITNSRIALAHLKSKVASGLDSGEVWITITDP